MHWGLIARAGVCFSVFFLVVRVYIFDLLYREALIGKLDALTAEWADQDWDDDESFVVKFKTKKNRQGMGQKSVTDEAASVRPKKKTKRAPTSGASATASGSTNSSDSTKFRTWLDSRPKSAAAAYQIRLSLVGAGTERVLVMSSETKLWKLSQFICTAFDVSSGKAEHNSQVYV